MPRCDPSAHVAAILELLLLPIFVGIQELARTRRCGEQLVQIWDPTGDHLVCSISPERPQ